MFDIIFKIQLLYIVAIILWILLFFWLQTYSPLICEAKSLSWIFLFLPLIVYLLNLYWIRSTEQTISKYMFQGNFLSFGFLIVVILINWNSPFSPQDKVTFFRVLLIAFILIMVSLIDLWMPENLLQFHFHLRSILQTAALSLLAYALYLYYSESQNNVEF